MGYEISISENGKYIHVRVDVKISAEIAKEFAEAAIREAKKNNLLRILVDVRKSPNITSSLEKYTLAYEEMSRFELDRNTMIAVLISPEDKSHSFIETVFLNAGYNCRIFSDKKAAIAWFEK